MTFPRLRVLLGTFPVVGLGDGAVLVIGTSGIVFGLVVFPQWCSIVVAFLGGGYVSMAEINTLGFASGDCDKKDRCNSG